MKRNREARGLTQVELAMYTKTKDGRPLSPSIISKLETGERPCSAGMAIRIAYALDVDVMESLTVAGYINEEYRSGLQPHSKKTNIVWEEGHDI